MTERDKDDKRSVEDILRESSDDVRLRELTKDIFKDMYPRLSGPLFDPITDREVYVYIPFIKYLLGYLSDDEREAFEDAFFADDALYERLTTVESDLIDVYVDGRLLPILRLSFEQSYLSSPSKKEKVEAAQAMRKYVAEQKDR